MLPLSSCCWGSVFTTPPHGWVSASVCELPDKRLMNPSAWRSIQKSNQSDPGCRLWAVSASAVESVIMGKEQDLLVAVKSGDLLLAHKLLSKVKCNKTSKYGAHRGRGIVGFLLFLCNVVFVLCSRPGSVILSTVKQNKDSRARAIASGYVVASKPSAVSLR